MKLIKCIIQPHKLEDAAAALKDLVRGLTVTEARGHGRQRGHTVVYRGLEYEVSLLPKVVIDIVAEDNRVEDIVEAVMRAARTGGIGDGRIFVLPVEENYHVRTGFMEMD